MVPTGGATPCVRGENLIHHRAGWRRRRLRHAWRLPHRGPYQGEIYELYISPSIKALDSASICSRPAASLSTAAVCAAYRQALAENTIATDFYGAAAAVP